MGHATFVKKTPDGVEETDEIEADIPPSLIDWKQIWKPINPRHRRLFDERHHRCHHTP